MAPQHCQNAKQLSFQLQDQGSSSTQSSGQSYSEVASLGESNPYGQSITSMGSGYKGTHGKPEDSHIKPDLSMVTPNYISPPPQVDYRQSFAYIPLSYPDPYYHRLAAAYGPQSMEYDGQMTKE
ncbi:unnamed protein product [Ilex paraguariensis]|uniref:Uncharacterized protein n=1 Tax=Ilex paraguariensis TaxID=185542 RepID=A0ABC8UFV9_9AQUA